MSDKVKKIAAAVAILIAVAAGSAAFATAQADDNDSRTESSMDGDHHSGFHEDSGAPDEELLAGDVAEAATDAALEEVPGGTIIRVETDADQEAAFEAHVAKANGTEVTVLMDNEFNVIEVAEFGH
jgi:uncharacterized membrane protein YkoI